VTEQQPREAVTQQFAEKQNSSPEVSLPQGSFLFPPRFYSGPAEFLEFWRDRADISEETLSNVWNAYANARDAWAEQQLADWAGRHGNDPQVLRDTKNMSFLESQAYDAAARAKFVEQLEVERPSRLDPSIVRTVATAGAMWNQLGRLEPEEAELVKKAPVTTNRQGGPVSLETMYRQFHLEEIFPDALYDNGVSRKLDAVKEELSRIRLNV
jgi:hypothetical protein